MRKKKPGNLYHFLNLAVVSKVILSFVKGRKVNIILKIYIVTCFSKMWNILIYVPFKNILEKHKSSLLQTY